MSHCKSRLDIGLLKRRDFFWSCKVSDAQNAGRDQPSTSEFCSVTEDYARM